MDPVLSRSQDPVHDGSAAPFATSRGPDRRQREHAARDSVGAEVPTASVNAFRELLDSDPAIHRIKAQLRAILYKSIANDGSDASEPTTANNSVEAMLMNELVREYLQYSGYEHTLAVFEHEAGMGNAAAVPRSIMAREVGCLGAVHQPVPLLFAMLAEGRRAAGYA